MASPPRFDPATRVLITGGASGIGRSVAARFVAEGVRVAVLDRDDAALDGARSELGEIELALRADVACPASVEDAFAKLDKRWGGLDVLVNNAGVSERSPFLAATFEHWRRIMAVNLTGAFVVAQQPARRMHRDGDGSIVNMSSVSGMVGMPGYAAYNSSKAGVIALTQTMALELAPQVRVNAICPGYILTPMQEAEHSPQALDGQRSSVPLGRLGRPAEIAGLAAYLASDEARFVTGQTFVIDGGESAGGLASKAYTA